MNSYIDDLQAVQAVYLERLQKRREPISLGRPKKARLVRQADEGNVRSVPGFQRTLQSAARAVAGFLM